MSKSVFFSVGEPSGDQHAAELIDQLKSLDPSITTRGFGGPQMRDAGCDLQCEMTEHAVFGLLEVIPKIREFFRLADDAETVFRNGEVDAVVLVDFPGFNWHVAKRARRHGIPVYYYCPPQLWAWGRWRVGKMRRNVDHVLAVLPVEQEFFSGQGIPATFVGHPFFDSVEHSVLDQVLLRQFEARQEAGERLVAVLPGSRNQEVERNWPLMLESIRQLHRLHPRARFLVAAYDHAKERWCRDQRSESDGNLPIDFHVGRTSEIIEAAHCAMMVSGSVSLEMMARRTPAAVLYRVGRLVHAVGSAVVKVDSITLPNLMAGRKVYPEFVSVGPSKPAIEFLVKSIDSLLGDSFYYRDTVAKLEELRSRYAQPGASVRAARWLRDRLEATPESATRKAA